MFDLAIYAAPPSSPMHPSPSKPTSRLLVLTTSSIVALCALACGSGTAERAEAANEEETEWVPPDGPPKGSPVDRYGQLRLEGTQLVDRDGNAVQLKGVSTQWLNYEGSFSSNPDNVSWMAKHWDIDVIRGAMGVEDSGGYLDGPDNMQRRVELVIQHAIDAGVYVIVDWHSHHAEMNQAEAVSFFSKMAEKWGDYPHIIWETFNEPWGDYDWSGVLKPYHEAVVAAIRKQDKDNIIVLGTPFWSQHPEAALEGSEPVEGETPPGAVEGTNLMYTLHFYACTHGADVRANGQAALDAGLPVFVTEWGATTADGGILAQGGRLCEPEATEWMDWMEENKISWAAWRLDACTDISCLLKPGAPYSGNWSEDDLNGHGPFVVANLKK